MKLKVDDIQFNIVVNESELNTTKTPVVFLHGFTGSAKDWQFIFNKLQSKYLPIAFDLIGHGETDSPENQKHYTCSAIVYQIDSIISKLGIQKFIIAGYSMGGRAALSYSLKHPDKISAAIFESTTAGITDIHEMKDRVELDLLLSDKIKSEGIKSFTEFWFDMPLFAQLKNLPNFQQILNKRNQNSVVGLSNMLIGFSTGLMPGYWDRLHTLNIPVLLLSGHLDEKYTKLNQSMKLRFPQAKHFIIEECGHNVHLEKPQLFTKFVEDFLNSL